MTETGPGERPAWPEAVPESVRTAIEGVPVDIGPGPVEAEGRIFSGSGPDVVRQVVAAWVTAVNGDESALRALAEIWAPPTTATPPPTTCCIRSARTG